MPWPVPPGGRYFWLGSTYTGGEVGRPITFESAVASVAASTTRDVAIWEPLHEFPQDFPRNGPPFVMSHHHSELSISFGLSYDQGFWDDHPGYPFMGGGSKLIVAVYGQAQDFVTTDEIEDWYHIWHYVSADGGQTVKLDGIANAPPNPPEVFDRIIIWRVAGDPAQPEFWTSFVGSREII